jgi:LCP family protein required for cell wall assembly
MAYEMIRSSLIPGAYLLLALLVPGAIATLLYLLLKKQFTGVKRWIVIAAAVLVAAANLYAYSVALSANKFFIAIQDDGYSYIEYSIIAKKETHADLSKGPHTTALLATDTNTDLVKAEVDSRTTTTYKQYDNLVAGKNALHDSATDLATFKSSHVQLLQENDQAFYGSIEVLATFTIKVKNETSPTVKDNTKPFAVYISGIDTYGAIETVSRSDVNILAVVNPQTHKILLVNTPRDYYVQLHGTTGLKDKLTHAGMYGTDMSRQTLEDLYGMQIDYYVRVNFASLTNIIDTLGGVNVFSDYTFDSQSYSFTTGYNKVDGKMALDFARTRYAFEDGDRQRGKNQQHVIEAIIQKLNSPSTLTNFPAILASLQGTFETNVTSAGIGTMISQQMDGSRNWTVESTSVDGTSASQYTYSMGAIPLYVMIPDQTTVDTAKQKIQATLAK